MIRTPRAIVVCGLAAVTLGCAGPAGPGGPAVDDAAASRSAAQLSRKVTVEAMTGHLRALQDIADSNGGTRAIGTPGYDATVDHIVGALRGAGFDVQTPEFPTRLFTHGEPELTVGGVPFDAGVLQYSAGTPAGGVSGPLVAAPSDPTPGCTAADYDGLSVGGAVVLVDRGGCLTLGKQAIVTELGAAAMILADNVDEERLVGTLGASTPVSIPVVSVSKTDGARLRAAPGPVTIRLQASTTPITVRSVLAQTKTGSTGDVVMAGSHLDSVPGSAGINDDGSGVAALLETAVQLGSEPPLTNAVRFAFWGAEEVGIVGSTKYVESLTVGELMDIAMYLNFDMLGSPNPGYFTQDGDQSTAPGGDQTPPRVPDGSAGIERTLVGYLRSAGKAAEDTPFDGRSDYAPFTDAGVPAGGLYSGSNERKTAQQAELWGGTADAPFDPNYHKPTDTLDRVDRTALEINGRGVAWSIGYYGTELGGPNGVPARDDRTRAEIGDR